MKKLIFGLMICLMTINLLHASLSPVQEIDELNLDTSSLTPEDLARLEAHDQEPANSDLDSQSDTSQAHNDTSNNDNEWRGVDEKQDEENSDILEE